MKRWLAVAVCLLLVACEYDVALVSEPETPIDKALLGIWEVKGTNGKPERLLVLPLSEKEYMISYPAGASDAMFARVCLFQMVGKKWAQLRWFGTAKADLPDDNRVYQYVAYSLDGKRLTVQLLKSDTVPKTLATPDAVRRSIEQHKDDPTLLGEAEVFEKVSQ